MYMDTRSTGQTRIQAGCRTVVAKWGLHLAAVRSGRGAARWSGLPELLRRAACLVQGLSGLAALASGVRVPVVRLAGGVAGSGGSLA